MTAIEEGTSRIAGEARRMRNELHERVEERMEHHKERLRSTTKTRKSANTRRRIMDTASELMVERGNTAFQMSEISKRCNMSKGALYYYFSDKEDLLEAIYIEKIDELVDSIDDAVGRSDTAEGALRGACKAYAECVREGGPLAMALVRELVTARDEQEGLAGERAIHHIMNVVAEQLERAKAEGLIRPDVNTQLTSVAVCGAFAFTAMSASDLGGNAATSDFADELFRIIVDGIGIHASS